jgi:DNA primase
VNVYGRAIETSADSAPKYVRHAHLPGPKSVFNQKALGSETVMVCEGAFDCLALLCSGVLNAVAIFGVTGICWEWFASVRRIVFAFDLDDAGERAFQLLAVEAIIRGKEVFRLGRERYRGEKDLAASFAKIGRIEIADRSREQDFLKGKIAPGS